MERPLRVMWLINHTTLRKFEIPQMESLGIDEIFLPKSFPYDEGNLSANVDWSRDSALSIPADELRILNDQNWYKSPSPEAWEIANRHFDILFLGFFPEQIRSVVRNFKGVVVLHAFGLSGNETYGNLLRHYLTVGDFQKFKGIANRFFFGAGYEHLANNEEEFIRTRNCFLPVGLAINDRTAEWKGSDKRIFFVCPRINTTEYFRNIYESFARDFSEFPFLVGGAQPVEHTDKRVLGFVDRETHERNMRELAVMFYHSQEPNHIHYHPFEAIQAGMPLIFMAGGVLDRFGGKTLPGRCVSIAEARQKVRRVLSGDKTFVEGLRKTQGILLEAMRPENCAPHWHEGFDRICSVARSLRATSASTAAKKHKIAVILPIDYRGGTLRAAKMIAEAIHIGSQRASEPVDVVFGHLDAPGAYHDDDFYDLPKAIQRRPFRWAVLSSDQAQIAATYGDLKRWPSGSAYQAPDDGMQQFADCDLWVFVSDRLERSLLELRPYAMFVFDYLIRYEKLHSGDVVQPFLDAARRAERVFVTTEFTRQDAISYAGVEQDRVVRLPILAPFFKTRPSPAAERKKPFFIWTTNLAPHKNHENAFRALVHYYDKLEGNLRCLVTGVGTSELLTADRPYLRSSVELYKRTASLRRNLKFAGELSDSSYQSQLVNAEFLWHAGRVDNGTFSVVEAAHLGTPSLSSDYPSMREFDRTFSLNLSWMDPHDPQQMAEQLKTIELNAQALRAALPPDEFLAQHSIENLADHYWKAVKECL